VPTVNPLEGSFSFDLSVPKITVRMVDAAGLEEYELWFAAASVSASAAIGFLVAFFQSFQQETLVSGRLVHQGGSTADLIVTVLFTLFLIAAGLRVLVLRRRIHQKSATYSMQAVRDVSPD